ncbi:hypothetical protein, partial [Paraburkholderia caribensis]|uniref:hypothetical protein n=1 Tax=Paraburkholderia caribensis TaxID=75105 RepID=UPI0025AE82FE
MVYDEKSLLGLSKRLRTGLSAEELHIEPEAVAYNHGAGLRVLFHEVGQGFDVAIAFLLDLGLVEVELDVQFDTDGFGRLGNGDL